MKSQPSHPLQTVVVLAAVLAVGAAGAPAGDPALPKPLQIVAYINQASGCQQETEKLLRDLAVQHGDRVRLEMVDFGGPGRQRWKDDGMHCMGIRLDGTTETEITAAGVTLRVRFEMPAGYQWTHDELATAVRQKLHGISDADRKTPAVEVRTEGTRHWLTVGGQPTVGLPDRPRIDKAATLLRQVPGPGLTREDIVAAQGQDGTWSVATRGTTILTVTAEDATKEKCTAQTLATVWADALGQPYPVRTRPFPGVGNPTAR